MPYELKKKGNKWCVYKEDTGEEVGCSDTKKEGIAHLRLKHHVHEDRPLTKQKK